MTDGRDCSICMTVLYDAIIMGGSGGSAGCEVAELTVVAPWEG